jgi:hypothetical protein
MRDSLPDFSGWRCTNLPGYRLSAWRTTRKTLLGGLAACLTTQLALVASAVPALNVDFENGTAGQKPTGTNLTVSPSSPSGQTTSLPITAVSNGPIGVIIGPYSGSPALPSVGSGKFARVYDYNLGGSGSGAILQYDFVSSPTNEATAIKVSFKFAAITNITISSNPFRFGVTKMGYAVNTTTNRPMGLNIDNTGVLMLDLKNTNNDHSTNFDTAVAHEVVVYLNDDDGTNTLDIVGPDGVPRTMATNSVAVFLDTGFVGVGPFDDTLSYRTTPSNLGRCGFSTITSEAYIDFVIDDLVVDILRENAGVYVPSVPPTFGAGGLDLSNINLDPEVLLWEQFPYGAGELNNFSSARWKRVELTPVLQATNSAVLFDYANPGTNRGHYARNFTGDRQLVRDVSTNSQVGPVCYQAFTITADQAPAAGATGYFLALQGVASATTLNGHVWMRAGNTANAYQLGVSTDGTSNSTMFAATDLTTGTVHRVVVRYDATSNDSSLWIDPADSNAPPDAAASVASDQGTYLFTGEALCISNSVNLGRFQLKDLRIATTFAAALATTPIQHPVAEIRRSSSAYSILSDSFDAYITGNCLLTYLRHAGLFWLAQEGGWWTASGPPTVQNSINNGSFYFKTFMLHEMAAGGMGDGRLTIVLQNNDTNTTATYQLALDATVAAHARTADGTWSATPLNLTGAGASDVTYHEASGRALRLTGFSRLIAGTGSNTNRQYLALDIPANSVRQFTITFEPLSIDAPQNWQVFQRTQRTSGPVTVSGRAPEGADSVTVEFASGDLLAPPLAGSLPAGPQPVTLNTATLMFNSTFTLPAGGWYQATVRAWSGATLLAQTTIERVGVGEVFVASGQSNSTNSGEDNSDAPNLIHTQPASGLVSSFSGAHWQEASDPQPGPHDQSTSGSYYPAFGDDLAARFGVPVAVASAGQGSTAVAEWVPNAPYDYTDFASSYHNGLYQWMLARARQIGTNNFRALLWHQGESDSSHTIGTTRTSFTDYYNRLKLVIQSSQADAGWTIPWFIARASVWPLDNAGPDPENPIGDVNISGAQMQLCTDGFAYAGANSDSLGLSYRDLGGSRVHFAVPTGLAAHGALWAQKVGDYIDTQYQGVGAVDSDGGGAPDYWERQYGFDPASNADDAADPDHDGLDNRGEFITGGNPFVSDGFSAVPVPQGGGQIQLRYRARAGRTYILEHRAALETGSWSELTRTNATVDNDNAVFTVDPGGDRQGFYRIVAQMTE